MHSCEGSLYIYEGVQRRVRREVCISVLEVCVAVREVCITVREVCIFVREYRGV